MITAALIIVCVIAAVIALIGIGVRELIKHFEEWQR